MVDVALLEALELLTPSEQKAILAVAEFLKSQRGDDQANARALTEALLAELPAGEPRFQTSEGLSPARMAARRFMRENPTLMRLLAQ